MRRRRILALVPLLGVLLIAYTFVEPHILHIRPVVFRHPDLPEAFHGLSIVFLSDIHHGPFLSLPRVREVVRRTNELSPDLILLGGDYVHRDVKYIEPVFTELAQLSAPLGVYGVLGNHDHWESQAKTRKAMRAAGIVSIDNDAVWIGRGGARMRLGGVGDLWEDAQRLNVTLEGTAEEDFVLLVSHNPEYASDVVDPRIDLMLSGHTHGGQCSVLGLWAPILPSRTGNKYRSGWVQAPHTTVFISNGIGTITPPVRFCTPPQILYMQLERRGS